MGSKPSAPPPMNVANVTAEANKQNTSNAEQQAAYNRPDQTNQYGSTLSWQQTGVDANGNPTFSQVQGLGQQGQDFSQGFSGLGQQYIQQAGALAGQAPPDSNAAFDKAYTSATAMSAPQQQRQSDQLDTQLRNQGLVPGMPGYDNAMLDLRNSFSQQNNTLMAGLQNQLWNQGAQGLALQQNSLGLLQPGVGYGSQAITGGFAGVPGINVANVDVAGLNTAAQQQAMQQYQAQMQAYGAGLGGLASLGGTLGGAAIKSLPMMML